jgi:thioredoxin-like negative regulator of GroEL
MFLGQVYYWLGKSKDGKELFDQLLEQNKRAGPFLLAISRTLRDVGEHAQARALLEEAYRTAQTPKEKFEAAAFRAHIQKDNDDQIAWLEKSDTNDPPIQIALHGARGEKSLHEGNKKAAAQSLRLALAGYEKLPRNAPTLNNWGLVCLHLYEATGNPEDQQRGLALLEEAIGVDPGNSVLLNNTLYFLYSRAVLEVVRDAIRIDALGVQPGVDLLAHLYGDEAERARVYQRLRESESMKKCLAYLDRALLLAPKKLSLYEVGLQIQTSFLDLAELRKLQQRFRVATPDSTEEKQETLDAYRGAKDQENLDKLQARIRKFEALLEASAVKEHPLTLEHVITSLNGLRQNLTVYGGATDRPKLLVEALTAYRKHPSIASQAALISSYLFCADEELAKQSPDYAALASHTRRAVSPRYLLAFVLERGGPLAEVARRNSNLLQALTLEKERGQRLPSFRHIVEWALFRTADPTEAALVARKLQENEAGRLASELRFQLNSCGASEVLEEYWTRKMLGQDKAAMEVYQQALRNGVPLPGL